MQLSAKNLENRIKCRVQLRDDEYTRFDHLFGEPVKVDETGCYVIVPAHTMIKQYIKDLHPYWKLGEDFIDISDAQVPGVEKAPIVTIEEAKPEEFTPVEPVPTTRKK